MFALCISVCTTTSNVTVIWEENFDDLDDWTIFAYENSTSLVTKEGNFSVADGTLKVLDDDFNVARRDSDVTVGSWLFDMYVVDDDEGWFYVVFMSNGTKPLDFSQEFVAVGAWISGGQFLAWQKSGDGVAVHSEMYMDSLQGLHHVKVNRTSGGHFEVYLNGVLRGFFDDNSVTNSTYLEIEGGNAAGCYIDNIIVSDDPNYPIPTPTTPPPGDFPWILVAVGGGVAVAVIVLTIVVLRRR